MKVWVYLKLIYLRKSNQLWGYLKSCNLEVGTMLESAYNFDKAYYLKTALQIIMK